MTEKRSVRDSMNSKTSGREISQAGIKFREEVELFIHIYSHISITLNQ